MTDFTRRALFGGAKTSPAAAALPGLYQMRVEELDYTPGSGVPMGGYGWGDRRSDGSVSRRLRGHCVALTDLANQTLVLVRVDVISIPRHVYLDIVSRLRSENLIADPQRFVLAQSHTHHGPMVGRIPDPYILLGNEDAVTETNRFTVDFVDQIVALVRRTVTGAKTPVKLGYAEGLAYVGRNRAGLPWTPREVPVLLAKNADTGMAVAVLYGHACHPVCQTRHTTNLDSDYCGRATDEIQRRLGIPALFFQGTAGDIDPVVSNADAAVVQTGNQVADAVVAMVRGRALIPVSGPMFTAQETVQLPFSVNMSSGGEVAELRAKYQQRFDTLSDDGEEGAGKRHAERLLAMIDNGSVPKSMPMTIQRINLGGLTILTMAHEVLSGYHVGTKRKFGKPLWIMAYANHVDCYVAADDKLWAGGYEAGWNGDSRIAGIGTAGNSYSLPAPLKASPKDQPGHPDATEGLVAGAIARLLGV